MDATTLRNLITVLLTGSVTTMFCAPPPEIGIAMARGGFEVNHSAVVGNATVFDGNVIQTAKASSSIRLSNGVRVTLASNSRAAIYNDKLVLQEGQTEAELGSKYQIQSAFLRIVPTSKDASAQVAMAKNGVKVAVVRGSVNVTNAGGTLLARMAPGAALEYEQQPAGASMPQGHASIAGTLRKQGDNYLLTDDTSRVTYQLLGAIPRDKVGQTVNVSGELVPGQTPVAGADQVLRLDTGGQPAGMAPMHGMHATHGIVIAGILIAGAGIALGVTLANGEKQPVSATP
jgi:hypothetical protein